MHPKELVFGRMYVISVNGFRYTAKLTGTSNNYPTKKGIIYHFKLLDNQGRVKRSIEVPYQDISTTVEYEKYTQLGLKLA